jgi:hypothetical protein
MFEIRTENSLGLFHVKLNKDLTMNEIMQLASLASNIVPKPENNTTVYTVEEPPPVSFIGQSKLGEHPVDSIKLGSYVEPEVGVRIRMLSYSENIMQAVKLFRAMTGLPLFACKEIIYGNHPCPILTLEKAKCIMQEFRVLDVYATVDHDQRRGG